MSYNACAGLAALILGFAICDVSAAAADPSLMCADPAVVAAIDRQETRLANENRLPGSGIPLHSLDVLVRSGVQITGHRIEIIGGEQTADPNKTICLVKLRLQAKTAKGAKQAEEDFAYRIERVADVLTVTFCPNHDCALATGEVKLASPAR